MKMPHVRRRWVLLMVVFILALGPLWLLYQPLTLESYRMLDPQILAVVGYGVPGVWTNVSEVTETPTTATVSVNAFTFEPFPHTDEGARLEVQVQLRMPLGGRTVVDGSTGQIIPAPGG